MCGRFGLEFDDDFYPRFLVGNLLPSIESNYNIAPGQFTPIIFSDDDKSYKVELMKWGLVPFWAKEEKIGYKMINARLESIQKKPSFKQAFIKRRCLVPATNFYEWQKTDNSKQPFSISVKDEKYFAMAGLFEVWKDTQEKTLKTFTIITTKANSQVNQIHDRMPVILERSEEKQWLSYEIQQEKALQIAESHNKNQLKMIKVSTSVNNPRNNSKSNIQQII